MHLVSARENSIDGGKSIVQRVAEGVRRNAERYVSRRRQRIAGDRHERSTERIQHAIELHSHLVGERPAGVVIRWGRRSAGIWNVVRMYLRLEHVEDVRTECLRRSHDERVRRIASAGDSEWRGRAMDDYSCLDQGVG